MIRTRSGGWGEGVEKPLYCLGWINRKKTHISGRGDPQNSLILGEKKSDALSSITFEPGFYKICIIKEERKREKSWTGSVLCLVMDRKLFKPQEMGLIPATQCERLPGLLWSLGLLAKQIPQETEIQDGQRAPTFSKKQPKSSPPCCPPSGKSLGQSSLCACFSGSFTASSKVCSAA